MAANLEEIAEQLDSLTLLEASQLSKRLQEKWGVSAAVAMAAPAAGAAGSFASLRVVVIWPSRRVVEMRCVLEPAP
jgi:ribosomal protein L7/L12